MRRSWLRTLRFIRGWLRRGPPVDVDELEIDGEAGPLPTSRFRPSTGPTGGAAGRSAWILLHGVTRPGRRHPQLIRFARALAGAGATVLVPEIREWSELRLAPERTVPVVRACVRHLEGRGGGGAPPALVGFSFGAPQALRTVAHPSLQGRIGGVVGFGAYADVERTFRFQLTGRHEWRDREEHLDPDPYGRWVIAANYLTAVPAYAGADDVADALRELAAIAGDRRIPADAPDLDPERRRLREGVEAARRPLFDLFAPASGSGEDPAPERRRTLPRAIADAAKQAAPGLEVRPHLHGIRCPVELVHGRRDRLIPYTETLRLAEWLPSHVRRNVTVTELFSHASENPVRAGFATAREGWRFLCTMRRVLGLV